MGTVIRVESVGSGVKDLDGETAREFLGRSRVELGLEAPRMGLVYTMPREDDKFIFQDGLTAICHFVKIRYHKATSTCLPNPQETRPC